MNSRRQTVWLTLAVFLVVLVPVVIWGVVSTRSTPTDGRYDSLAQCLAKQGTRMYGASWCGHCQNQKKSFGGAFQYINYIECSVVGSSGQAEACRLANITSYPTWVLASGERLEGEISLETLAQKSGCSQQQSLTIGQVKLSVSVSNTDAVRQQGLSGRESLGENEGMLFVYDQPGGHRFWMQGMKFPLDFIWINQNQVVGVTENVSVDQTDIRPPQAVDKILEVNSGWVKQRGIKIGDAVSL
jgi:uncharacterized membrane protein (UPF0127 family)